MGSDGSRMPCCGSCMERTQHFTAQVLWDLWCYPLSHLTEPLKEFFMFILGIVITEWNHLLPFSMHLIAVFLTEACALDMRRNVEFWCWSFQRKGILRLETHSWWLRKGRIELSLYQGSDGSEQGSLCPSSLSSNTCLHLYLANLVMSVYLFTEPHKFKLPI